MQGPEPGRTGSGPNQAGTRLGPGRGRARVGTGQGWYPEAWRDDRQPLRDYVRGLLDDAKTSLVQITEDSN